MHDRTWPQPYFLSCLQPCLSSERRGILGVWEEETWVEKPVQALGLAHSAERWDLAWALHC